MFKLEVRVMVDGVRVVSVGEGGNTNSVWEGVETVDCEKGGCAVLAFFNRLPRRWRGGGAGFRDSARRRKGGDG